MLFNKGNRWKGERGMGGGEGGSVYSQPGSRVDRDSRHDTKEGFPSK
jgi:hypothetical protein